MEKSFLVKVIGLGGDNQDVHELRAPNRVLSWKGRDGIWLEAASRHLQILISELEQDVRGLNTHGVKNQLRKDG